MRRRILHVITTLTTGGAEVMLDKLVSRTRHEVSVVSLVPGGAIGERIARRGIPVSSMGMSLGVPDPRGMLRLSRIVRGWRPHLVQTWMYHADLVAGTTVRALHGIPVVWNVRQSNLDPAGTKRSTILTARLCARLSRTVPRRVVCCSEVAQRVHVELGYAEDKFTVLPNGFDLDTFRPDGEARAAVRRELGVPDGVPLVGLVARFDPQKDHANFFQAAARLRSLGPEVHFVLAGDGVTGGNPELRAMAEAAGVVNSVHLLGRRDDIPRLTAALDLAVSSSFGEGFPNAVGEAMAAGVPCAVTHVGDSAYIVGGEGVVVPPRDATALAEGMHAILSLEAEEKAALGARARERVRRMFSLDYVVARYDDLHESVIANG